MTIADERLAGLRIFEVAQGSPEWHLARCGVITASMFSEVRKRVGGLDDRQTAYVNAMKSGHSEEMAREIAGYKAPPKSETVKRALAGEKVGDFTDAAKAYAFRLAVERMSGALLDTSGFETWAMRRGRALEEDARTEHMVQSGLLIAKAGFVCTEDRKFGVSADGFVVGQPAGAEYKCLIDPVRLRRVLLEQSLDEFMDQMQGGMWLTGMEQWHFGLYCPDLAVIGGPLYWRVVERDDDYIYELEQDLLAFDRYVEGFRGLLQAIQWAPGDPPPPWQDVAAVEEEAPAAKPQIPIPPRIPSRPAIAPAALVDNPF